MNQAEAFELLAEWPEGVSAGEPDAAAITLRANGHVLTRLADVARGEARAHVRASAVSLALWIADHWWRLRYEPFPATLVPSTDWRLRHELTSVSGGVIWPPLMIYGEGARVMIAPRAGTTDVAGPVRYLNAPVVSVGARPYEEGVDAFFRNVAAECATSTDGDALIALLKELTSEREDADVAPCRRLEAMLGYDADCAPDELIAGLQKLQEKIGEDAVDEGAVSAPGPDAAVALEAALEAAAASEVVVDLRVARELRSAGGRPTSAVPPWRLAEIATQELRHRVGMQKGSIRSRALADILGASKDKLDDARSTAARLPYGARAVAMHLADKDQIAVQWKSARQRRFELARALGEAAWDSGALFAPLSRARTDRQKFQRAFAQSLLCPFDELMAYINSPNPTERDVLAAAKHFHVSESVVRTVLVNKEVLPRERLEDRLEAA